MQLRPSHCLVVASPLPLLWVSFSGGFQHSPIDGCSAASCNFLFSKEKMSAHPSTPPPGSGFLMGSVQGVPGDQREGGKARHLLTLIPSGRVAAGSSQCPTEHSPPLCLSCNLLYMLFRPVSSSGSRPLGASPCPMHTLILLLDSL